MKTKALPIILAVAFLGTNHACAQRKPDKMVPSGLEVQVKQFFIDKKAQARARQRGAERTGAGGVGLPRGGRERRLGHGGEHLPNAAPRSLSVRGYSRRPAPAHNGLATCERRLRRLRAM